MRYLFASLIFLLSTAFAFAQEGSTDLAGVQKELKNDINKNVPSASGVSFEGCKMSLKLTRGEYVTVMKDLTGQRERDLNPMKPQPTTDRPGDEAARNLSSGAGDDYSTIQTDKFTIDFALLPTSAIEASVQRTGKLVSVGIFPVPGRPAISRKDGGKTLTPSSLIVGVKESAAGRIVATMQQVASACSAQPK